MQSKQVLNRYKQAFECRGPFNNNTTKLMVPNIVLRAVSKVSWTNKWMNVPDPYIESVHCWQIETKDLLKRA